MIYRTRRTSNPWPLALLAFGLSVVALVYAMSQHVEREAVETTEAVTTEAPPQLEETLAPIPEPVDPVEALAPYTWEDLEHLALVIYQEAGGDDCSDETRMAVGTVVMNRVASKHFPDTIAEVLTQRAQYGRLYWTGLEWPERASQDVETHAVQRAYDCALRILEGERTLPADVVYQAEFKQGTETVLYLDGMYFGR